MTDHEPPGQPPLVFPELYRVSDELADIFAGTFSRETIDRYLNSTQASSPSPPDSGSTSPARSPSRSPARSSAPPTS